MRPPGFGLKENMADYDPIATTIREAQRLSALGDEVRPIEIGSALGLAREILQSAYERPIEIRKPIAPMGALTIDLAIRLRWILRHIDRKRTKLSPVSPEDLGRLLELGLIV